MGSTPLNKCDHVQWNPPSPFTKNLTAFTKCFPGYASDSSSNLFSDFSSVFAKSHLIN